MTDYYEIAMGIKKPKTVQDDIKIERKDFKETKKKDNIEIIKKIRNKKLKLVANNLMIGNDDNNIPKLTDGSNKDTNNNNYH